MRQTTEKEHDLLSFLVPEIASLQLHIILTDQGIGRRRVAAGDILLHSRARAMPAEILSGMCTSLRSGVQYEYVYSTVQYSTRTVQ